MAPELKEETFNTGDVVRVREGAVHIKPQFHSTEGTVIRWTHDHWYIVNIAYSVTLLRASELQLVRRAG